MNNTRFVDVSAEEIMAMVEKQKKKILLLKFTQT